MARASIVVLACHTRFMAILFCFFLPIIFSAIAAPQHALAAAGPVRLGVILPYTGFFSNSGQEASKGFELYLAKIGGMAAGRSLQVIKEDTEAKPDVGLTKTRKLVERDNVDILVGPVSSAVALAIRDYVHQRAIPLVVPVASTRDLTAPTKASPWIFRVSETSDQPNYPMGHWVIKNTPYRKIAIIGSDFVAAHHGLDAFIASFKAAGGDIVKEIYPPLNTPDFAPYMAQLSALRADAVYAWFSGADTIRFVKTYQEYGLAGKLPLLGYNTLVDDILLHAIGDAAQGIVSVGQYSAALDTPENRAFVGDYRAKYNEWPTRYSENGYVSAQLIVAAVESLRGEVADRGKFREALNRVITQINPPRGPLKFDRYQQVITHVYVMRVERRGGRLINAILDKIPDVSQEDTWKWWNK